MKKVAIQGIKGCFHEEAAVKFFGEDITSVPCRNFAATCRSVKSGEADFATLAIENTIAGTILTNYQLIRDYQLNVVGEVYIPINLYLLARPEVKFADLKYVQSHPMAIRQCQDFFEQYPDITLLEKADTAACAKELVDNELDNTAAIASIHCADIYGLKTLEKRIEKHKKNYTRFLVLSKENHVLDGAKKMTLSFRVKHRVGALAEVLTSLSNNGVNLCKIQSLPLVDEPDNYQFYLDIECPDSKAIDIALMSILRLVSEFSILGEYKNNDDRKHLYKQA